MLIVNHLWYSEGMGKNVDSKKRSKIPLSKTHPKLAKEAHGWDPSKVTYGSDKNLLWKCVKGHIWGAAPLNNLTI